MISTMPEHVAKDRGKNEWFTRLAAEVMPVTILVTDPQLPMGEAMNWYYGPNPVDPDFLPKRPDVKDAKTGEMRRPRGGRPNKHDITRLSSVWMDLDFKAKAAGGCGDRETAEKIIDAASDRLGCKPAIVVASGHGLQPLWSIEDGEITECFTTADANTLLARFGEFAAVVGAVFGASVDGVYEATRLLRMPGSVNNKQPDEPVPAVIESGGGGALSLSELSDRLNEYGIPEATCHRSRGESSTTNGPIVSEPGTWVWGTTCGYVAAVIKAWATDAPSSEGRHPWLRNQWVRLASMHRIGCISESDYHTTEEVLSDRFAYLCATTGDKRAVGPREIEDVAAWAVAIVATKDDEHVTGDLGTHKHAATKNGKNGPQGPVQQVGPVQKSPPGVDTGPPEAPLEAAAVETRDILEEISVWLGRFICTNRLFRHRSIDPVGCSYPPVHGDLHNPQTDP